MNELAMMKRAQLYMDLLSQQKDPFSGKELEGDTVLTNERLLRCFRFVSQILQQTINEKEGSAQSVPLDVRSPGIKDLPLSQITQKLRSCTEDLTPPLETSELTEWLLLSGYLKRIVREDGAHRIIPTDSGKACGIYRAERRRRDGRLYHLNLFTPNAQNLIQEHLQEILQQSSRRIFQGKKSSSE